MRNDSVNKPFAKIGFFTCGIYSQIAQKQIAA